MREILTNQGDTWDIISWREYGTEKRVAELMEVNTDHRQVVIFPANVTIRIPEIVVDDSRSSSPPWRRNG